MMTLAHDLLQGPASHQWEKIGTKERHGIAFPLFSMRSKLSGGIGEFYDLMPVVDWAASLGLSILQLLPLCDSGSDPSPYNALSAFALNPIFLSLHKLPSIEKYPDLQESIASLRHQPLTPHIDYEAVRLKKNELLRLYWSREYANCYTLPAYQQYLHAHPWLKGYSLFKTLKKKNNWRSWMEWPQNERMPTEEQFLELFQKHADDVGFHLFIQYLCDLQLSAAKQYAESRGILLMGDIPILLSPDSASTWHRPHLFNLNYSAGAPPDMYSTDGQSWGFPLFNWDAMESEDYRWWKERLSINERYYHLYRLDHIVGFFRIWAIPKGRKAKDGSYLPKEPELWYAQGEKILRKLLMSSTMLPIGEDLGVIPPLVRKTMQQLGICGTKVPRWERYWEGDQSFIDGKDYPPLSLTCVSTHDSEPLTLWWENAPDEAKAYCHFKRWHYTPQLTEDARLSILHDSHHTASIFHVNPLLEYFALFEDLSWTNPSDMRINTPGTISNVNWNMCNRTFIEDWTEHKHLNKTLKKLIAG